MRARVSLAVWILLPTLLMVIWGCGGAPADSERGEMSDASTSAPEIQPEPILSSPETEDPETAVQPLPEPVDAAMSVNTEGDFDLNEHEIVVTWTRAAGALQHNDELSIDEAGRVRAIVRNASQDENIAQATLNEDQAALVMAWADEYAAFTRREIDDTHAVSTTRMHGSGVTVAMSEIQAEIADYLAELFFEMTETQ